MIRAVLLIPLLVAACSRHDQKAAAPPPPSPAPTAAQPAPPPAPPATGSGPDVHHPCAMITAAEVSGIVGFTVTAQDEQFRCKFVDAKNGWLQLELMEATSRSAKDICEYAKDKRTVVPGVGDSASYFGATACVKRGDVAIIVDATNTAVDSPEIHKSGADAPQIRVAKLVASRIP